ncbi:MAG: SGNH/GDSL hydrolase family protein, partial [Gemmataceae bacterium]|nr:SGNH/GDSL hydrolase family protein [Gemmataceae bacterium]
MYPRPRLSAEPLEAREVPAAFQTLPVLDFGNAAVLDNARTIAARGALLGRRTDVFLKIGDSNTADTNYLVPLGRAGFNPVGSGLAAVRPDLVDTLAAYRAPVDGSGFNSFNQPRRIAFGGGYLPILLPYLDGEVAATNAGVALVMVGTNDATITRNPEQYRANLTYLVTRLADAGVVPVLSTVPDILLYNGAYGGDVNAVNQVIADVGGQYRVPVWNLWRQLAALPARGLKSDLLHLNATAGGGRFIGADLLFGQNVRNLQALEILDWFRERVAGGSPDLPPPSPWAPLAAGGSYYAVGRDIGQGPVVTVNDAATGRELNRFLAFEPSFAGGVRVAVADVTGDGVPDVVAGAGAGGGPAVRVFDGTDGSLAASFFAYEPSFRGGVGSVAAADLDGDGTAEVVVGAGNGGGPVVAVYRGGDFAEVGRFAAYEGAFRGGVNVAAGVFAGVGPGVVTGAGPGGGPAVHLFAFG